MILTCPECATRYFVDDVKVSAEGKVVCCANCQTRWTAYPEIAVEDEAPRLDEPTIETAPEPVSEIVPQTVPEIISQDAEAPVEAAPEPESQGAANQVSRQFRAKAETQRTVRAAVANGVVWAGMAGACALLLVTAALFRTDVVRLVPRTASAYAAVGLAVNPTGVEFSKVEASPKLQNGHVALVVSGLIRNVDKRPVATPTLRVAILDKAGRTLAVRNADAGGGKIAVGGSHPFALAVLDPPKNAHGVEVTVASGKLKKTAPASGQDVHPAAAIHPAEGLALRGPTSPEAVDHHEIEPLTGDEVSADAKDDPHIATAHEGHG